MKAATQPFNSSTQPYFENRAPFSWEMAYQNQKHHNYGWKYHMYEPTTVESAYPKHNQKGRAVAFRTNYEEQPIAAEAAGSYVEAREITETARQRTRFGDQDAYGYESVDQEAEDFIQYEHRRMELARLMSEMKPTRGWGSNISTTRILYNDPVISWILANRLVQQLSELVSQSSN